MEEQFKETVKALWLSTPDKEYHLKAFPNLAGEELAKAQFEFKTFAALKDMTAAFNAYMNSVWYKYKPAVAANNLRAVIQASIHMLKVIDPKITADKLAELTYTEWQRAKAKHGEHTFDSPLMPEYSKIMAFMEEYGEVARALTYDKEHSGNLLDEIVQVIGLAVAWLLLVEATNQKQWLTRNNRISVF